MGPKTTTMQKPVAYWSGARSRDLRLTSATPYFFQKRLQLESHAHVLCHAMVIIKTVSTVS